MDETGFKLWLEKAPKNAKSPNFEGVKNNFPQISARQFFDMLFNNTYIFRKCMLYMWQMVAKKYIAFFGGKIHFFEKNTLKKYSNFQITAKIRYFQHFQLKLDGK